MTSKIASKSATFKQFLSDDDIKIAKALFDSNVLSKEQISAKFQVHPVTITNRVKALEKSDGDNDNPIYSKELCNAINLIIILNKRLVTQLAQVDFNEFKSFDEITKALKTLGTILTPLHAAYRSETSKSNAVQVNLTQIIEKNWENEELRKTKMIDVLRNTTNSTVRKKGTRDCKNNNT